MVILNCNNCPIQNVMRTLTSLGHFGLAHTCDVNSHLVIRTDLVPVRDQCVLPVCVRTVHQIFTKSGRGAYKAAYVRNIM